MDSPPKKDNQRQKERKKEKKGRERQKITLARVCYAATARRGAVTRPRLRLLLLRRRSPIPRSSGPHLRHRYLQRPAGPHRA